MIRVLSRALGWASAVLGAIQLVAPARLLASIGLAPTGGRMLLTRAIGAREMSVVPGLLTASLPWNWLAARVVGDIIDLVLLVRGHGAPDARRGRVRAAIAVVLGFLAVDASAAVAARRERSRRTSNDARIVRSVTVNRPVGELYAFWRDFERLPTVMPHLESVTVGADRRSHWIARGPLGTTVEWDAETIDEVPNELIAWQSLPGSTVQHAGNVRFRAAPGGRGTEVRVEMEYRPPGGPLGTAVAALTGEEPRQQLADALRRFKQVMETGEAIVSAATVTGHKIMQRPAQPPDEESVPIAIGREPAEVSS